MNNSLENREDFIEYSHLREIVDHIRKVRFFPKKFMVNVATGDGEEIKLKDILEEAVFLANDPGDLGKICFGAQYVNQEKRVKLEYKLRYLVANNFGRYRKNKTRCTLINDSMCDLYSSLYDAIYKNEELKANAKTFWFLKEIFQFIRHYFSLHKYYYLYELAKKNIEDKGGIIMTSTEFDQMNKFMNHESNTKWVYNYDNYTVLVTPRGTRVRVQGMNVVQCDELRWILKKLKDENFAYAGDFRPKNMASKFRDITVCSSFFVDEISEKDIVDEKDDFLLHKMEFGRKSKILKSMKQLSLEQAESVNLDLIKGVQKLSEILDDFTEIPNVEFTIGNITFETQPVLSRVDSVDSRVVNPATKYRILIRASKDPSLPTEMDYVLAPSEDGDRSKDRVRIIFDGKSGGNEIYLDILQFETDVYSSHRSTFNIKDGFRLNFIDALSTSPGGVRYGKKVLHALLEEVIELALFVKEEEVENESEMQVQEKIIEEVLEQEKSEVEYPKSIANFEHFKVLEGLRFGLVKYDGNLYRLVRVQKGKENIVKAGKSSKDIFRKATGGLYELPENYLLKEIHLPNFTRSIERGKVYAALKPFNVQKIYNADGSGRTTGGSSHEDYQRRFLINDQEEKRTGTLLSEKGKKHYATNTALDGVGDMQISSELFLHSYNQGGKLKPKFVELLPKIFNKKILLSLEETYKDANERHNPHLQCSGFRKKKSKG